MKITLHMAVSIDGYIAGLDGRSSWVSAKDEELFVRRCREAGAMAVGRRTYEQYRDVLYPVAGTDNIVLTQSTEGVARDRVYFVRSAQEALGKAQSLGHKALLVSGGSRTSASFLNDGLLDEIFLSVHPVILGNGMRVFEGGRFDDGFALADVQELGEGLAQLHYRKK